MRRKTKVEPPPSPPTWSEMTEGYFEYAKGLALDVAESASSTFSSKASSDPVAKTSRNPPSKKDKKQGGKKGVVRSAGTRGQPANKAQPSSGIPNDRWSFISEGHSQATAKALQMSEAVKGRASTLAATAAERSRVSSIRIGEVLGTDVPPHTAGGLLVLLVAVVIVTMSLTLRRQPKQRLANSVGTSSTLQAPHEGNANASPGEKNDGNATEGAISPSKSEGCKARSEPKESNVEGTPALLQSVHEENLVAESSSPSHGGLDNPRPDGAPGSSKAPSRTSLNEATSSSVDATANVTIDQETSSREHAEAAHAATTASARAGSGAVKARGNHTRKATKSDLSTQISEANRAAVVTAGGIPTSLEEDMNQARGAGFAGAGGGQPLPPSLLPSDNAGPEMSDGAKDAANQLAVNVQQGADDLQRDALSAADGVSSAMSGTVQAARAAMEHALSSTEGEKIAKNEERSVKEKEAEDSGGVCKPSAGTVSRPTPSSGAADRKRRLSVPTLPNPFRTRVQKVKSDAHTESDAAGSDSFTVFSGHRTTEHEPDPHVSPTEITNSTPWIAEGKPPTPPPLVVSPSPTSLSPFVTEATVVNVPGNASPQPKYPQVPATSPLLQSIVRPKASSPSDPSRDALNGPDPLADPQATISGQNLHDPNGTSLADGLLAAADAGKPSGTALEGPAGVPSPNEGDHHVAGREVMISPSGSTLTRGPEAHALMDGDGKMIVDGDNDGGDVWQANDEVDGDRRVSSGSSALACLKEAAVLDAEIEDDLLRGAVDGKDADDAKHGSANTSLPGDGQAPSQMIGVDLHEQATREPVAEQPSARDVQSHVDDSSIAQTSTQAGEEATEGNRPKDASSNVESPSSVCNEDADVGKPVTYAEAARGAVDDTVPSVCHENADVGKPATYAEAALGAVDDTVPVLPPVAIPVGDNASPPDSEGLVADTDTDPPADQQRHDAVDLSGSVVDADVNVVLDPPQADKVGTGLENLHAMSVDDEKEEYPGKWGSDATHHEEIEETRRRASAPVESTMPLVPHDSSPTLSLKEAESSAADRPSSLPRESIELSPMSASSVKKVGSFFWRKKSMDEAQSAEDKESDQPRSRRKRVMSLKSFRKKSAKG